MANVTVNNQNYTGVNEVCLPITNGGGSEQRFVLPPSGTKNITANGNGIDVANYAAVNVNVPTGITPTGTKNISQNGDYDVTQFATAHVNVSGEAPALQQKNVTAPASGTTDVTPDSGYDGLSKVTVSPTPTETKSITANGTYTPASGKHFSQVTVNVPGDTPQTQEKTVTPSTSQQVITPDSGKLLSKVTVGAIQTETKTATPSTSAQTVTPTSGKYLTSVSIGAIQTETKSATPSEAAQQITPASGKFLTRVDVGAISPSYVGSGVTRKSAQTYTPGTTNQTIAANQYLNGVQTIKGDANLVAANIKKDVQIFGVTGTHEGGGSTVQTYTGTFSTNRDGETTVNCGFRPDVVVIDFGTYILEGYTYRATLTFPLCINPTNWYEVCAWGEPLGINMIDGEIGATSTSFSLWLHEITENWQFVHYANKGPFNVTAYKFL